MSPLVDIESPRHRGAERGRSTRADRSERRRQWAAILGVELSYVLAVAIAVPIGRGAVALAIALAFLLAVTVGTRMRSRRERALKRRPEVVDRSDRRRPSPVPIRLSEDPHECPN